jgi:acetyl esterase/lipase
MTILAHILTWFSLTLNLILFVRLRPPFNFMLLWMPQLFHHAISPLLVLSGLLGAALGWWAGAPIAVAAGLISAALSAIYIWRVIRPHRAFDDAFGPDWEGQMSDHQRSTMLPRRWSLGLPRTDDPRWERDIAFCTIPGADRQLLCDLWQPPEGTHPSGLGFVFLHGSGWYLSDKDFGTRPFFRQLTAQGHVVMDVAYRLCPEVDMIDMVGDVKRAVAWMKSRAQRYGVDPEKIVLAGGSAGGHLALLAAYAPNHPQLTPSDLQDCDLSVRGVVSLYGPTDLRAVYDRTVQTRTIGLPNVEIGLPDAADAEKTFRDAGRLDLLMGGHPNEVPERYDLASPITHVHSDCPPTLQLYGDIDCVTSPDAFPAIHRRLTDCGVPAVTIVYPWTQHGFDLMLPNVSPPAQAALYEVERFLALMV